MSEETIKQEGEEQTKSVKDNDEGSQSETVKDTERILAETERLNKAIAEKENAEARAKIAGVVEGPEQVEEKKEETPEEYKDRIMSGG